MEWVNRISFDEDEEHVIILHLSESHDVTFLLHLEMEGKRKERKKEKKGRKKKEEKRTLQLACRRQPEEGRRPRELTAPARSQRPSRLERQIPRGKERERKKSKQTRPKDGREEGEEKKISKPLTRNSQGSVPGRSHTISMWT